MEDNYKQQKQDLNNAIHKAIEDNDYNTLKDLLENNNNKDMIRELLGTRSQNSVNNAENSLPTYMSDGSPHPKYGSLFPLHGAIIRHSSIKIIDLLIEHYPEAFNERILEQGRDALYDYLPIHYALMKKSSEDRIRSILKHNPNHAIKPLQYHNDIYLESTQVHTLEAAITYETPINIIHLLIDECPDIVKPLIKREKKDSLVYTLANRLKPQHIKSHHTPAYYKHDPKKVEFFVEVLTAIIGVDPLALERSSEGGKNIWGVSDQSKGVSPFKSRTDMYKRILKEMQGLPPEKLKSGHFALLKSLVSEDGLPSLKTLPLLSSFWNQQDTKEVISYLASDKCGDGHELLKLGLNQHTKAGVDQFFYQYSNALGNLYPREEYDNKKPQNIQGTPKTGGSAQPYLGFPSFKKTNAELTEPLLPKGNSSQKFAPSDKKYPPPSSSNAGLRTTTAWWR